MRSSLPRSLALLFSSMLLLMSLSGCATDDPLEPPSTGAPECDCLNGAACAEDGSCVCQAGFYGADCGQRCDCGQGACDDGASGTGACTCPAGIFGAECAGQCDCPAGTICDEGAGGTGACLWCPDGSMTPCAEPDPEPSCECAHGGVCAEDGACICQPGFYGPSCAQVCACAEGASCDDGASGTGACACAPGTWGDLCDRDCECAGGACDQQTGACGVCPEGTYGSECAGQCDCQNGAICDDGEQGTGACTCQPGTYGPDCSGQCACQGSASCDDGAAGSGQCTCGPGTYGPDCSGQCGCQNGGGCDEGISGDGSCSCPAGTYGPACAGICPGGLGDVCSGHGACDDGATGSGACACTGGYSGADCSTPPSACMPGSSVGDVMIVEVMFDAPNSGGASEPDAEYVMLYNNSCGAADLVGWKLCDNAGCRTLGAITLEAGDGVAIVCDLGAAGLGSYGCADHAAIFGAAQAFDEGSWFSNNLSNSGDLLELQNAQGVIVDALSYGGDTTVFASSIGDPGAGNAIQRLGYPWSGQLPSNDSAAAWEASPSGGHICSLSAGGQFQ